MAGSGGARQGSGFGVQGSGRAGVSSGWNRRTDRSIWRRKIRTEYEVTLVPVRAWAITLFGGPKREQPAESGRLYLYNDTPSEYDAVVSESEFPGAGR